MPRVVFILFYFSPNEQRGGGGGEWGCVVRLFFSHFFTPVQQTTSGIGHRVNQFFRVGNQCAECEKQQQQQLFIYISVIVYLGINRSRERGRGVHCPDFLVLLFFFCLADHKRD